MAGTMSGGQKAAQTNKERYGKDFYRHIGSVGGKISSNREWAITPEGRAAQSAHGAIGGRISRKGSNA